MVSELRRWTPMNMSLNNEDKIYQRIGEFAVSFQWLENKLREIGWLILDPERSKWPPTELRNLTNEKLIDRVYDLFLLVLPMCRLTPELESDFRESFGSCASTLHQLRKDRNRILHSAFIELKCGDDVQSLMRSNPRLQVDEETGETLYDEEFLTPESFSNDMQKMAEVAVILNRSYIQLMHRYRIG